MAELTKTQIGKRRTVGNHFELTWRVEDASAAAGEYITTGFDRVLAVRGVVPIGADPCTYQTLLNAQDAGDTEGDHPGDVCILLANVVATSDLFVTVMGEGWNG